MVRKRKTPFSKNKATKKLTKPSRDPQDLPLTAYVSAAMGRAKYKKLKDGSWWAKIPQLPGVFAIAERKMEIKRELQSVLESWIMVGLYLQHKIQVIDGIDIKVTSFASRIDEEVYVKVYEDKFGASLSGRELALLAKKLSTVKDAKEADALREQISMGFHGIAPDDAIQMVPFTRDGRVSCEVIVREMGEGKSPEEILKAHPGLTLTGLRAALKYAAGVVNKRWLQKQADLERSRQRAGLIELIGTMDLDQEPSVVQEADVLIRYVLLRLSRTFKNQSTAQKWLRGINAHLRNNRPIDLLRQDKVSEVISAIEQLETGSPA